MPQFEEIALGKVTRGRKTSGLLVLAVFAAHFVTFKAPSPYPQDLFLSLLALPLTQVFGVEGWRVFHALVYALSSLLFFVFLHRMTSQRWLAAVGAVFLTVNPVVLSFPYPTAGSVSLLASVGVLATLFARPRRPWVAGALAGLMVAVSPWSVVLLPVLFTWLGMGVPEVRGVRSRVRAVLCEVSLAAAGVVALLVPAGLLWSGILEIPLMGRAVAEAGQTVLLDVFSVESLFNYPFYVHLVRTPHFPFPAFLYLILAFVHAFGLIGIVVMLLGVVQAWRAHSRISALMVSWFLVVYFVWAFREDFSLYRLTYFFVALPPLLFFLVYGLERFGRLALVRRNVVLSLLWGLGLYFGLKVTFFLEFSQDLRWYGKHEVARVVEAGEPAYDLSDEMGRMLTVETPQEHREGKLKFTQGSPLPSWIVTPAWWKEFGGAPEKGRGNEADRKGHRPTEEAQGTKRADGGISPQG